MRAPCSVPHSPSSFSKPTGSPIQHEVRSTAQWSPVLNASRSQLPWASPCHLLHSDALQRCQLSESDQRFVRCQPLEASPEWFVAMRYTIDWKACEKSLPRSSGQHRCMGRFTRALLLQKVNQIGFMRR